MEKKKFLDGYRLAISESPSFKTVDEVRQLVVNVLSIRKDLNDTNDKEPLVDFIIENLDSVPFNWFTDELLIKAFKVNVPGAVIISDTLKLPEKQLEFFKGIKYISGNRMLVFNEKNVILCDVTFCNPSDLINKFNDEAKSIMSERNILNCKEGKKPNKKTNTLKSILDQCRWQSSDYDDDRIYTLDSDERQGFYKGE